MKGLYDDIIDLPYHVSKTRPQMSMADRAAQFSPFAALTGHDAAIKETGRLTDERIELDNSELNDLNMKVQILLEHLNDRPQVEIVYFEPDKLKSGGKYVTVTCVVKKFMEAEKMLVLESGDKLQLENILQIHGAVFTIAD